MKILIAGGSGFFGKWLIKTSNIISSLTNSSPYELLILSKNPKKLKKELIDFEKFPNIYLIEGDIREPFFYKKFSYEKIDFIIHCAMPSHYSSLSKKEILEIGIEGTKNLLEFAKLSQVKRFLFVSSGVVYGIQPFYIKKISEKETGFLNLDFTQAKTYYTQAKLTGELLCFSALYECNIDIVIARCFSFIGPYMNLSSQTAVGNFIRDAIKGKAIAIKSDGTKINSYMYAEDLGKWLWTILFKGKKGEIYNVGSEKEISLKNLAKKIADISQKLFQKNLKIIVEQTPKPGKIPERYVPSTKKAQTELGLKEYTSLDEAIEKTLKFYHTFQGAFPEFQSSSK